LSLSWQSLWSDYGR